MKSRDNILLNIKQSIGNKHLALIDLNSNIKTFYPDLLKVFINSLEIVSATCHIISDIDEIKAKIPEINQNNIRLVNSIPELNIKGIDIDTITNPKDLYPLDIAIVKGIFGVAENGAIWVIPDHLRISPFLCETLVAVLNKKDLVPDMHAAYNKLQDFDYDYGVFISGPSKTADIEQTLVIGAQGPSKMIVLIIND